MGMFKFFCHRNFQGLYWSHLFSIAKDAMNPRAWRLQIRVNRDTLVNFSVKVYCILRGVRVTSRFLGWPGRSWTELVLPLASVRIGMDSDPIRLGLGTVTASWYPENGRCVDNNLHDKVRIRRGEWLMVITYVRAISNKVDPAILPSFQNHQNRNVGLGQGMSKRIFCVLQRWSHRGCKNRNCCRAACMVIISRNSEKEKAYMSVRMASVLNLGWIFSVLNSGIKNMVVRKMLIYLQGPGY